jgi:uncharacterized integral membrane protein (TIGR00698 family)
VLARHLPGLALAGAGALAALLLAAPLPALSPIPVAVGLGILVANAATLPAATRSGLALCAKRILRLGVVLLGFRLVVGDLAALGPRAVLLVAGVALATLAGVVLLGWGLGVTRGLRLLTGTGFAICGASAIAAAQSTVDADDEEVAAALGLVLLFGTVSIALLPLAASVLDLPAAVGGAWLGAAVHDVGQAVAAAELLGPEALEVAVVVKLGRVLLLGPVLVVLALLVRRGATGGATGDTTGRPSAPLVPLFVVGFAAAVIVRSLEVLPVAALSGIGLAERASFALALFALGTQVRLERLRHLGWRPVALGSLAYAVVTLVSLAGAVLVLGDTLAA